MVSTTSSPNGFPNIRLMDILQFMTKIEPFFSKESTLAQRKMALVLSLIIVEVFLTKEISEMTNTTVGEGQTVILDNSEMDTTMVMEYIQQIPPTMKDSLIEDCTMEKEFTLLVKK